MLQLTNPKGASIKYVRPEGGRGGLKNPDKVGQGGEGGSGEFGRPNLLFFNSYFSVKLMTAKFLATNCYVFCVYIPL